MILYRLSKCNYADDLSGTGARLYGARWNSIGVPMVYFASSRSLALLEVLVHLPPALIPDNFCMSVYQVPDDFIEFKVRQLPQNWSEMEYQTNIQKIGDSFIKSKSNLLCKVPSIIIHDEYNFLLNPLHPLAGEAKLLEREAFSFDKRLF